jgi:RNA polymerase sigma-70 factor (ECF subfamily)
MLRSFAAMTSEAWHEQVRAALEGCSSVTLAAAIVHVGAALEGGGSAVHAGDLALAYAITAGDPVAMRRFETQFAGELAAAVRAIDASPAFVTEIVQRARIRLLVAEGAPPRIASYRGGGPLRAWLAIATQRIALNAKRDTKRDQPAGDDVLADLVDREPDPELRYLKTLYRREFREALSAALAGVSDRARAVLRLRFVGRLELAEIGRVYRVHESTISRWITTALADIANASRRELAARLAVTPATADSVARLVHSQLDLSLERLLA